MEGMQCIPHRSPIPVCCSAARLQHAIPRAYHLPQDTPGRSRRDCSSTCRFLIGPALQVPGSGTASEQRCSATAAESFELPHSVCSSPLTGFFGALCMQVDMPPLRTPIMKDYFAGAAYTDVVPVKRTTGRSPVTQSGRPGQLHMLLMVPL